MEVYEIIEYLKATPGLNDKREILREHKNNLALQTVLTHTMDPRITYGIKKIPQYYPCDFGGRAIENSITRLSKLIDREVTGHAATAYLKEILENSETDDAKVIEWVIAKDFKAGFGTSIVNDEMQPFQVYEVPYMGATSYSEKRLEQIFEKHPYAYSEVKYDGRYINTIIENDTVFFESRGGRPNPLMGALEHEASLFREAAGYDGAVNGELMLRGISDRYKSNGIIASYVSIAQKHFDGKDITKEKAKFSKEHHLTLQEVKEMLTIVVWDYIPIEDYRKSIYQEARSTRIVKLEEIIAKAQVFQMVEYKIVNNKVEAMEHFLEMLKRGEEGTILKGSNGEWKDGKPVWQMKMKLEIDLDLRITGFNYGTPGTKNEGVISSLNVESECGLLKTSPGGIKESMMDYITANQDELMGMLVEIKCSGLSQDSEGNWSCLHPAFKVIRDDKDIANTLNEAQDIEAGAKGLLV